MIYIKDFGQINRQLFEEPESDLAFWLSGLVGQIITVFTDSGGVSGSGFTGLLLEAGKEGIVLVTEFPSPPVLPCPINEPRRCHTRWHPERFGTRVFIVYSHICAVVSNYA